MKILLVSLLCIYSGIESDIETRSRTPDRPITIPESSRVYRPGGAVTNPVPTVQTTPQYSDKALKERLEGTVWLQGIIRKNGRVDSFKVIRNPEGEKGAELVRLAVYEVYENWRFKPGTLNGTPVDVLATIEVQFNLGRGSRKPSPPERKPPSVIPVLRRIGAQR